MLTITLPAVKFLVPVTGSYSFGAPGGVTTANGAAGTSDAITPPTIEYMVPATTTAEPKVNYTPPKPNSAAPQHLPAFTPPANSVSGTPAAKAETTASKISEAAPEQPPTPVVDAAANAPAEVSVPVSAEPPPPPPVTRAVNGLPKGQ
jgi:hypothetical protein